MFDLNSTLETARSTQKVRAVVLRQKSIACIETGHDLAAAYFANRSGEEERMSESDPVGAEHHRKLAGLFKKAAVRAGEMSDHDADFNEGDDPALSLSYKEDFVQAFDLGLRHIADDISRWTAPLRKVQERRAAALLASFSHRN